MFWCFLGPRGLALAWLVFHAYLPRRAPGSRTQGGVGCLMPQALCARVSLSSCPPAPAVPASAGGDGANCAHPHPGTRGPHQGAGEHTATSTSFPPSEITFWSSLPSEGMIRPHVKCITVAALKDAVRQY